MRRELCRGEKFYTPRDTAWKAMTIDRNESTAQQGFRQIAAAANAP